MLTMANTFDIGEITKQRLKTEVFSQLPDNEWHKLVVDEPALKVLSSHLDLSELIDHNISVVDPLHLSRSAAKSVAYLISPVLPSVNRLIEDFQQPKPLYDYAHIFFTSKAPNQVVSAVKSCTPLLNRLQTLREIHCEIANVEPRTFITEQHDAMQTFFSEHVDPSTRTTELRKAAQRLATVFTTLKMRPAKIIVQTPTDLPDLPDKEFRVQTCRDLGTMVQERLSKWAVKDSALFSGPACDLFILDRSFDILAPIMHPFHYAAIAHDLVRFIDGKVFRYEWQALDGSTKESEHAVDCKDSMWTEMRHMHIADVATTATQRLKEFGSSRLAKVERVDMGIDLGTAAQNLPEFMARKAQLSMHVSLSQRIFGEIDARDLITLGRLEQGIVFGEQKSNDILQQMQLWNKQGSSKGVPTKEDRMRLLLSYFATRPGRLGNRSRDDWSSVAQLSEDDMRTITNAQFLGVELSKEKRSGFRFNFTKRTGKAKTTRVDRTNRNEAALENGRFEPLLVESIEKFVAKKLPTGPGKEFDTVQGNSEFDMDLGQKAVANLGAKSVRTTAQPTWHNRRGASTTASTSADNGGYRNRVVVVYIVGGCTWSEIQAAHESSQRHGVDLVLGSTHVIESGNDFLAQLGTLSEKGEYMSLDMS